MLTAAVNLGGAATAGAVGLVVARTLGPEVRGHYAAVQAWGEVALVIGGLGQTAATTYFVAREPSRRRDYLASARRITLVAGLALAGGGWWLVPAVIPGREALILDCRLMIINICFALLGTAYIFGLMAQDQRSWNFARLSQPVIFALAVLPFAAFGNLSLTTVLALLVASSALQVAIAHQLCRAQSLTRGRAESVLSKQMIRYGLSHLASTAPLLAVSRLDQIVLAMTVPPATLGYYAIAVSMTMLMQPIVAALGWVAFPRLASSRLDTQDARWLRRTSVIASVLISTTAMSGISLAAPWLVPMVFGPAFSAAVPLVWLLAPGAVFLACGSVCGDLLRGMGRPSEVAKAQAISAVFAVGMIIVLVPRFGAAGAAVATSIAPAIALVMMWRSLGRQAILAEQPVHEPELEDTHA